MDSAVRGRGARGRPGGRRQERLARRDDPGAGTARSPHSRRVRDDRRSVPELPPLEQAGGAGARDPRRPASAGRRRPRAAQPRDPGAVRLGTAAARARERDPGGVPRPLCAVTARKRPTSRCARPRPPRTCPTASFAGAAGELPERARRRRSWPRRCGSAYASLFTPRAISYRIDMGFEHMQVALSVGVQKMVRSDLASAGVIFTLDPETGHRGVVLVTSSWGLGESVVQGRVVPDQFYVHKADARRGLRPLVRRKLGTKEVRLVYDGSGHRQRPQRARSRPRSARASRSRTTTCSRSRAGRSRIEEHYSRARGADTPMDIEWAKDGVTGELFIVQARPETVHSQRRARRRCGSTTLARARPSPLVQGLAVGEAIASGAARASIRDSEQLGVPARGDPRHRGDRPGLGAGDEARRRRS